MFQNLFDGPHGLCPPKVVLFIFLFLIYALTIPDLSFPSSLPIPDALPLVFVAFSPPLSSNFFYYHRKNLPLLRPVRSHYIDNSTRRL